MIRSMARSGRPRNGRGRAGIWTARRVRAGIDHGPALAGMMGKRQFQFDVWGDAVNSAKAIEASARPGSVSPSGRAWVHLRDRIDARSCGLFDLKGKETMELFDASSCRSRALRRRRLGLTTPRP